MTNVIHSFNSAYRILGSIAILLSSRILYFYLLQLFNPELFFTEYAIVLETLESSFRRRRENNKRKLSRSKMFATIVSINMWILHTMQSINSFSTIATQDSSNLLNR